MSRDPNEIRKEQNAYHDAQDDQAWLAKERRGMTASVYEGGLTGDWSSANSKFGIPPVGPGSARRATPTAGEQFRAHSNRFVRHLDSLCDGTLPLQLTSQWRCEIAKLDIEQLTQSLEIAIALRESCRQAKTRYQPSHNDMSLGMRFDNDMSRIREEVQWLIDILRHVIAIENSP